MKVTFDLDPSKHYTVIRARFLPHSSTTVTNHPRVVRLGKDEVGFETALFALDVGENYCWRCFAIHVRDEVKDGICPTCGGDFDD